MRILLLSAALCAAAVATGCVTATAHDVPHESRELTGERYAELVVEHAACDPGAGVLAMRLQRAVERSYDQTTTVDRQVQYVYHSLAAASVQAPSSRAGRAAMVPVAIVAGAVDLVLWVLTAPVAYPAGAVMGIDPEPVEEAITVTERFALEPGTVVLVTVGSGDTERRTAVTVGAGGRVRIPIDADAEPALAAGAATLTVRCRLQASPQVEARYTVGLVQLVGVLGAQIRGDLEERHYRWRRIHDAVPADAPGAGAVKAALQAKIEPLAKALR
ncbi:MAG: hypothetical protein ACYTGX_03050 [Planctomycetota bacterium]|jgi:hypothetical protein